MEMEEAVKVIEKANYVVVHPLTLAAKPYISEVSAFLESGGYRVDKAEIVRTDTGKATGVIKLEVFPFKMLERLEKEDRN